MHTCISNTTDLCCSYILVDALVNFNVVFISNLQLNNNGDISFNESLSDYTPEQFPLNDSVPIIAPYWADVDTRGTGNVWYRLTTDPEIILRVRNEIAVAFPQLSTSFIAQEVVVAAWDRVGYYDSQTNLVIIISRTNKINYTCYLSMHCLC